MGRRSSERQSSTTPLHVIYSSANSGVYGYASTSVDGVARNCSSETGITAAVPRSSVSADDLLNQRQAHHRSMQRHRQTLDNFAVCFTDPHQTPELTDAEKQLFQLRSKIRRSNLPDTRRRQGQQLADELSKTEPDCDTSVGLRPSIGTLPKATSVFAKYGLVGAPDGSRKRKLAAGETSEESNFDEVGGDSEEGRGGTGFGVCASCQH